MSAVSGATVDSCGDDRQSSRNFDHRKQWIEDEILRLAGIFSLDGAAYAVLSNHYHLVLHINAEESAGWSDTQVIARWHSLFKRTLQS